MTYEAVFVEREEMKEVEGRGKRRQRFEKIARIQHQG